MYTVYELNIWLSVILGYIYFCLKLHINGSIKQFIQTYLLLDCMQIFLKVLIEIDYHFTAFFFLISSYWDGHACCTLQMSSFRFVLMILLYMLCRRFTQKQLSFGLSCEWNYYLLMCLSLKRSPTPVNCGVYIGQVIRYLIGDYWMLLEHTHIVYCLIVTYFTESCLNSVIVAFFPAHMHVGKSAIRCTLSQESIGRQQMCGDWFAKHWWGTDRGGCHKICACLIYMFIWKLSCTCIGLKWPGSLKLNLLSRVLSLMILYPDLVNYCLSLLRKTIHCLKNQCSFKVPYW